jgi:AraC-like DNA-binding protein
MLTVGIRTISAQDLQYREFAPDASLAKDIEFLWALRARAPLASPLTQTSAGKSSLDLIVPLAGNFCAHAERHLFGDRDLGAYLVGPMSAPRPIVSEGRCTAVGVRFRPGCAQAFFRIPMHELTDRVLPVASVSAPFERRLCGAAHDVSAQVGQVQALQRLLRDARTPRADELVLAAMRLIEQHQGDIRVDAIADAVGIGVRRLERRFRAAVGLGPKLACRIARVRHAMDLMPRRAGVSWAELALSCGFYDQAHFIREFRFVVGTTPSFFADGCTSVSHSYNTAAARPGSVGCTDGI